RQHRSETRPEARAADLGRRPLGCRARACGSPGRRLGLVRGDARALSPEPGQDSRGGCVGRPHAGRFRARAPDLHHGWPRLRARALGVGGATQQALRAGLWPAGRQIWRHRHARAVRRAPGRLPRCRVHVLPHERHLRTPERARAAGADRRRGAAAPSTVKPRECRARVADRHALTSEILEVDLAMQDPPTFEFAAGQWVSVPLGPKTVRAYTIASTPLEPRRLTLCADLAPNGPGSAWFRGLAPGDPVSFKGPLGGFVYARADARR